MVAPLGVCYRYRESGGRPKKGNSVKRIVCAAALLMLACYPAAAGAATPPPPPTLASLAACGTASAQPVAITKVLTIVLENTDFGMIIGSPDAPNTNALATACGLATNYHGIQFPSLPNYIGLTSGQIPPAIAGDGIRGVDCQPTPGCESFDPSIFTQIGTAAAAAPDPATAPTWRTYAESMPANCGLVNSGNYAARHNPAVYYPNDAAACAVDDVPSGTPTLGALATDLAAGTLPSYGLLIPNLCNDGHNSCNGVGRVAEEDATIATWMPAILASRRLPQRTPAGRDHGRLELHRRKRQHAGDGARQPRRRRRDAGRDPLYALLAAAAERGAARPAAARKRGDGDRHGGGL